MTPPFCLAHPPRADVPPARGSVGRLAVRCVQGVRRAQEGHKAPHRRLNVARGRATSKGMRAWSVASQPGQGSGLVQFCGERGVGRMLCPGGPRRPSIRTRAASGPSAGRARRRAARPPPPLVPGHCTPGARKKQGQGKRPTGPPLLFPCPGGCPARSGASPSAALVRGSSRHCGARAPVPAPRAGSALPCGSIRPRLLRPGGSLGGPIGPGRLGTICAPPGQRSRSRSRSRPRGWPPAPPGYPRGTFGCPSGIPTHTPPGHRHAPP